MNCGVIFVSFLVEIISGFPVYKLKRNVPFLNETLELCMGVNLTKDLVCNQVPPNIQIACLFVVDFQCVRHHDVIARDKGTLSNSLINLGLSNSWYWSYTPMTLNNGFKSRLSGQYKNLTWLEIFVQSHWSVTSISAISWINDLCIVSTPSLIIRTASYMYLWMQDLSRMWDVSSCILRMTDQSIDSDVKSAFTRKFCNLLALFAQATQPLLLRLLIIMNKNRFVCARIFMGFLW